MAAKEIESEQSVHSGAGRQGVAEHRKVEFLLAQALDSKERS
jgi:hypothetical protein